MRAVVTGGAGFIGSHLVDALIGRGDEVLVIDDLSRGRVGRVNEKADLEEVSVTDRDRVTSLVRGFGPAWVYHLAAQIDVRDSVLDPSRDAEANVLGTISMLEAARECGARLLLCSSGGALYGRDAPVPSAESVFPLPESPYGVAKQAAELYVGLFNRLYGARHSVLRLANVYGARQDPAGEAGVVAVFCARALAGGSPVIFGDGGQTRDYVHVSDVVAAFLAAAASDAAGVWNIGTGAETSVLDLVDLVASAAGRALEPRFEPARAGELYRSCLDCERARTDLGWTPQVPLSAGIRDVYQWIAAGRSERAPALARAASDLFQ